jgi:hypothetical protein
VVHKADQSPPSSAEGKNKWSYTSAAPVHIQGIYMTNFALYKSVSRTALHQLCFCHFNFNSTKNCMRVAKIMHFCVQNHQLAVTQSSQQLVTSNTNALEQSTVSYQ